MSLSDFGERIRGLDLVLATHGFNVSRGGGVTSLSHWGQACALPPSSLFVGVLWPGDSQFLPVISYPFEGSEAIKSGQLLADFLNREARQAASLSFVSHSLGARTMLETVKNLRRKARRVVLMAGAIEDNCLEKEYRSAASNAERIYTLASKKDLVLKFAFPIGNPIGQLVMRGHPYFETALGLEGPESPIPIAQRGGAWQIPNGWDYGHGDYLPDGPIAHPVAPPVQAPGPGSGQPSTVKGWEPAWSAGAVATQAG